ncbi:hypothetical protein EYF80_019760 [Liparis tanakae]|uniref:Uncharacterized protein n=1 Tax=Liparis tanakae TaxID=230148 RepID=A0A4Z2HYK3_9TELE|nr:hypothetical protein EYF80_019760 [Liparis tanakae]
MSPCEIKLADFRFDKKQEWRIRNEEAPQEEKERGGNRTTSTDILNITDVSLLAEELKRWLGSEWQDTLADISGAAPRAKLGLVVGGAWGAHK